MTAPAPDLAAHISFPTTGITVAGQAVLLAIDDVSLPLRRNLCSYLTKPALHPEPVLTPRGMFTSKRVPSPLSRVRVVP